MSTFFGMRKISGVCALLNVPCFTSVGNLVLQADGRTAAERGSAGSQETHPPPAVEQRLQEGLQLRSIQRMSTQKALHEPKKTYRLYVKMCLQRKKTLEDGVKERHLVTSAL